MAESDPRLDRFEIRVIFAERATEGRALAQAGSSRATKLIAQSTSAVIRSREAIAESRILLARTFIARIW